MLVQLKYAGHFENVQAVILGDFSDLSNEANFPQTVVEMIQYHSQATVVDGLQSGHCKPNYPLLLGANHKLAVANHKASLTLTVHQDFLVSF
jgi:muramoyltetrapeptide carboxypeptidase LdcA involved in peptidoglycan recycling